MRRAWLLLAALLLPATGFAASGATPPGFTPAPVPNLDISPPPDGRDSNGRPAISGSLNQPHTSLNLGDGFTPGSQYSTSLEHRARPANGIAPGFSPTISVKFPLN